MRRSNQIFYKLGDVYPDLPIKEKLKKCYNLEVSVFLKVPRGLDVWAIDCQLKYLTGKDVVLSEIDPLFQLNLHQYFFNRNEDKKVKYTDRYIESLKEPKINTKNLCASKQLNYVEYLELQTDDVIKLSQLHNISIREFKGVYILDKEVKEFKLCNSVPAQEYRFTVGDSEVDFLKINLSKLIPCKEPKQLFVTCKSQYEDDVEFNHPINYVESNSVFSSECEILDSDVSKLVFDAFEYDNSDYYLEPEYHISTSFYEFSKAAFELLAKDVSIASGGVSGYLSIYHPSLKTKNVKEGGTYLIGKMKKNETDYFIRLKDIFSRYWLIQCNSLKNQRDALAVTESVVGALEDELGLKSSNAKGVEMMIRPDKYKKTW